MKLIKTINCLFFILFLLNSCEKVIEFDLAGAKEAIVIEASITSSRAPFTVRVTKTSPYFGSKTGNPVSGAKVSVRVERGKPKYFQETAPGRYTLEKTVAIAGYWYIIDVEYEGITYTARSYMFDAVPIVDLSFSYFDGLGFFENGYKVHCFIRDPVDQENYYRLKYFVNGKPTKDQGEITLYSDQLFNGKEIGLGQRGIVFQESDTLTVELQSVDKATYTYFSTLESITGAEWQQTAAPANPISNFNNGALGYFSAYSFSTRTAILKNYIQK